NSCEQAIKQYLLKYRGKYLNELDEFQEMLPTIENICEVLYKAIGQIVHRHGTRLVQIEVGDSPVALYAIGERLLLGSDYREISEGSYLKYKKEFETQ
ncbi:MAG: 6-carboxytetrahydropterin synthase, partial [Lachnospiraceae bacterium]|nr:6-carboxytetrahydropterin synthase [Lachnospiraceae bacterium]